MYVSGAIWEAVGHSKNLQRNGKHDTKHLKGLCSSRAEAEGQIGYPTETKTALDIIFRQFKEDFFFQDRIQSSNQRCLAYKI